MEPRLYCRFMYDVRFSFSVYYAFALILNIMQKQMVTYRLRISVSLPTSGTMILYRLHHCPHKEKGVAEGEIGKSEYRSRFEVHRDAVPPKSCKPPPEIVSTDLPLNETTIHRYITDCVLNLFISLIAKSTFPISVLPAQH